MKYLLTIFMTMQLMSLMASDLYCNWNSWFTYPKPYQTLPVGTDLTVKVNSASPRSIVYMSLRLNGKPVSVDSRYPFEWRASDPAHSSLRNLRQGSYKLTVLIKDRCGRGHYITCKFNVKGRINNQTAPVSCYVSNPMNELSWLRKYKSRHLRSSVCEYKKGGRTLFRVQNCHNQNLVYWYDCRGRLICRSGCGATFNAKKIKIWYAPCPTFSTGLPSLPKIGG